MNIRRATADDLQQVYSIYMHEEVVPYLGYDPMPLAQFEPIFRQLLASEIFDVCEADGQVLGFCKAIRHEGRSHHSALVGPLAVRPDSRGKGIARLLMQNVIATLKARGVSRIELTAERDNPRAIAFYEKLGFKHEGILRKAYKRATDAHYTDECLMALLLEDHG
ncbi:GNAT family N-acetyltransferase [Povalibacter sp.]|uniref:GNAT family N-acetyltransferase n=1 Tax=Povalibacter sp. TaxID=1962978 RepID=UPI002F3EE62A